MYVIDDLRLNCFKDVRIPSNKDLYRQFGLRDVSRPGSVGSDGDFSEPVNSIGSTLSDLSRGAREFNETYEAFKAAEEARMKLATDEPDDAAGSASE